MRITIPSVDSCWEWTRATKGHMGYGSLWLHGENVTAHRLSWFFFHGPIPQGKQVLHRCDNPRCVNPAHLFLGDNADNLSDKIAKGRQSRLKGCENGRAKLSEDDVRTIRRLYPDKSQSEIARQFGVNQTLISAIVRRIRWAHVA